MKRNLSKLQNSKFDLLIIGGGITGACLATDAAMRGLSVALVEKGDFGAATSSFPLQVNDELKLSLRQSSYSVQLGLTGYKMRI